MSKVAFLWDESFLWGLMAYKSLKAINLPFDLVRAEDIKKGCLEGYRMLFVPGGWASNKLKALGVDGVRQIKDFVKRGGNYFGICGGAGLATCEGIGLLDIKRKPTEERLPSFSGRIYLNIKEHLLWHGLHSSAVSPQPIFYAWWPSQFVVLGKDINVIATFGEALPDAFSSDLNIGDIDRTGKWSELEMLYGINLNPRKLIDEPAVVEGYYGEGRVILSLIHFDTPHDGNSAQVMKNIWRYITDEEDNIHNNRSDTPSASNLQPIACSLMKEVEELIDFGIRNFLWFWRTPMLLQWKRGIRGLEYCTLYVMIKEIVEILSTKKEGQNIDLDLNRIKEQLTFFIEKSKNLLILERYAMHYEHITYEKCFDPKIQQMRVELFGNSKSHGGFFKLLIDKIDAILFRLLDS